ncbi:hypothetical protein BKI52_12575 [marine bacterium AO1-C]|nr:hypothetical protein BKI52_12575 [marine bacterium AO1-C]
MSYSRTPDFRQYLKSLDDATFACICLADKTGWQVAFKAIGMSEAFCKHHSHRLHSFLLSGIHEYGRITQLQFAITNAYTWVGANQDDERNWHTINDIDDRLEGYLDEVAQDYEHVTLMNALHLLHVKSKAIDAASPARVYLLQTKTPD